MATKRTCDVCGINCTEQVGSIEIPAYYLASPLTRMKWASHSTHFNGKHVILMPRKSRLDLCPICQSEVEEKVADMVISLAKSKGMELVGKDPEPSIAPIIGSVDFGRVKRREGNRIEKADRTYTPSTHSGEPNPNL